MTKQIIIFLVAAPLLALLMVGMKVYYELNIKTYEGDPVEFTIRSGETFGSVNYRLHKEGLIESKKLFHRYSQAKGIMTSLRSGDYRIEPGMNMVQIINLFLEGKSITIPVSVPEGKNLYQIAKIYELQGFGDYEDFVALSKDSAFLQELGIEAESVEGYLFPETYNFSKQDGPRKIITKMVDQFMSITKDIDFTHPTLKSRHEVLTLASVVEKETGASWERPLIAGVFLNRLKKGMRLQSDPTIIYGVYESFRGNLTRTIINQTTPYNTYRINGLPKGPIANPGLEAIKAVLDPSKHDYVFFVSKNDGTHVFTETYKEHLEAVNYWQRIPENRKGKSWRDLQEREDTPAP